jgi:hypothetical protein
MKNINNLPHDLSVEVAALKVQSGGGGQGQTIPEGQNGDGDGEQAGENKSKVSHGVASYDKNNIL